MSKYFANTPQIAIKSQKSISKYDVDYFGTPVYVNLSKYSIKGDTQLWAMHEPAMRVVEMQQRDESVRVHENEIVQLDGTGKKMPPLSNERLSSLINTNNLGESQNVEK